jgi:hypothetical protein
MKASRTAASRAAERRLAATLRKSDHGFIDSLREVLGLAPIPTTWGKSQERLSERQRNRRKAALRVVAPAGSSSRDVVRGIDFEWNESEAM